MRLIDYDEIRKLFDEEYKRTMTFIRKGETHLDNLAEGYVGADKVIYKLPDVDAVEVVRCKDCEYFKSIDYNLNKCEEHSDGWGDHTVYVGEDDYCSFGVRKEGAENEG